MKKLKVFKALSNDSRLKIINLLDHDHLCACKILEKIDLSQSTISHHMKILEDAELVTSKKDGKWRYYSINSETFNELKLFFSELESTSNELKGIEKL
ncbi:MAG TPA: metalloregulator ArsR/SmtB family transcription factor [Clostridia bacterium]|nr:metalloregulator ArsR/SmtB family transcription factor [Clostridia bacterium]